MGRGSNWKAGIQEQSRALHYKNLTRDVRRSAQRVQLFFSWRSKAL